MRYTIASIAVVVVLSPLPDWASAQNADMAFERMTVEHGLPNNSVRSMVQDPLGFLWIAGGGAVVSRYDGYEFTHFRHDPSDSLSLGFGDVRLLYLDRAGNLWVGMSESGLHRFDWETETFTHFAHDPEDRNSLSAEDVVDIREDRAGKFWLLTTTEPSARVPKYLDRLDPSNGKVTRFRHDPGDPASLGASRPAWLGYGNLFMMFEEDDQGRIWIGTHSTGLNRFDPESGSFERFEHEPGDPSSLSDDRITDVHQDRSGRLWIATRSGLNLMDRELGTFTRYGHGADSANHENLNYIRALHEDGDGNLWAASVGGLMRFHPETGRFETFTHDERDPDHPGHAAKFPFVEDLRGDFWFFTRDIRGRAPNVLNHFDRSTGQLSYFRPDPEDPTSIPAGIRLEVILADRSGVVWIGG